MEYPKFIKDILKEISNQKELWENIYAIIISFSLFLAIVLSSLSFRFINIFQFVIGLWIIFSISMPLITFRILDWDFELSIMEYFIVFVLDIIVIILIIPAGVFLLLAFFDTLGVDIFDKEENNNCNLEINERSGSGFWWLE